MVSRVTKIPDLTGCTIREKTGGNVKNVWKATQAYLEALKEHGEHDAMRKSD